MPRNLTPLHLRCAAMASCPSINQLDSGEYLIVGRSATMAAACERIPVGEVEHAVIVSGELLANVVPGWKTIDSAPRDGTEIDLYGGFFAPKPMPGYWDRVEGDEQTWEGFAERVSGHIPDDQPTHWLPRPVPPAEKVEA